MAGLWFSAAFLCIVSLIVLFVPGAVIALAAGQRGWVVAFAAPPVTYGLVGIAGPLLPLLGLRWSPVMLVAVTLVFAGLAFAARRIFRRGEPEAPFWHRSRHFLLAGAIMLTAIVGLVAMYRASDAFTAIPQWWDAGFHADAVRFIADTGNSSPSALKAFAAPAATSYFYPNGYHVLAATVYSLGHWSVPQVLNVVNGCQAGVFGLSLACLVREVTGRPAFAIITGLLACAFTGFPYDVQVWGPLFPFTAAVALLPAVLALFLRVVAVPTAGRITVAALAVVGLTAVHPSVTISATVLAVLYLAQCWLTARRVPVADLRVLGVFAGVTCVLGVFQLLGTLTASGEPVVGWPPYEQAGDAFGRLVTGSDSLPLPQWWLTALAVVGLLTVRRIAALWWWLVGAGAFALLFVFAAYLGSPLVHALTAPWWGDSWRLAALATPGLVVLASLGLASLADLLAGVHRFRIVAFGLVVVALLAVTRGLYVGRNTERLAQLFPGGPVVSNDDVTAMNTLAKLVPPGSTVLNDPFDGSPWMLALDDLHPVFGQPLILPQDAPGEGPQRMLLLDHLNQLDTEPAVGQALRDLHVQYVYLGGGFLTPQLTRATGLRDLDSVHGLSLVYANAQARIYRVVTSYSGA